MLFFSISQCLHLSHSVTQYQFQFFFQFQFLNFVFIQFKRASYSLMWNTEMYFERIIAYFWKRYLGLKSWFWLTTDCFSSSCLIFFFVDQSLDFVAVQNLPLHDLLYNLLQPLPRLFLLWGEGKAWEQDCWPVLGSCHWPVFTSSRLFHHPFSPLISVLRFSKTTAADTPQIPCHVTSHHLPPAHAPNPTTPAC